jgi:hypothetical protein
VAELFRLRPPHGLPRVNGFIIYDYSMDLSSSALDISSPDALSGACWNSRRYEDYYFHRERRFAGTQEEYLPQQVHQLEKKKYQI